MKKKLNMDKIAEALGAERLGRVSATGGFFGAMQLLADINTRFRVPVGGGRATDSAWTARRLVPFKPQTLTRLEELAAKIRDECQVSIEPLQLAGLLLEKSTEQLSNGEGEKRLRPPTIQATASREAEINKGQSRQSVKRDHIVRVLNECNWVIAGPAGAAKKLGIGRSALQARMQKLGIAKPG